MTARPPRRPAWLSRNVLGLGLVSLFTDAASEMVIPLLPAFITTVLGGGALALGWIEGAADATASLLRLVAGRWSDRIGRRKPLVLAGYGLSNTIRPLIALTGSVGQVFVVRIADRVGKGLRGSPRDALIAASSPPAFRARAFSVQRALDHLGALIGPALATAFLLLVSRDLRVLFGLSLVPGLAAVLVLLLFVRETLSPGGADTRPSAGAASAREDATAARREGTAAGQAEAAAQPRPGVRRTAGLLRLLLPLGLFTLGNASDVFLLLKAGHERAPLVTLPLLWMGLHAVRVASSYPGGRLADRFGERRLIASGWVVYALIYTGFAFVSSAGGVALLFMAYGLYDGLSEGAEKALVSRLVPSRRWGSGFGWYHVTVGVLRLAASVLFGALWTWAGPAAAFLTSAALALAATLLLVALRPGAP